LAIVNSNIEKYQLALTREGDIDTQIVDFLDAMFSLIPTTVSKNWIKFTQYFEFWKQFATTGIPQFDYLIRKECISHFYDYFLEKKSPLGIYANKKHVIGSKYASPNFAPLLETANYLIMKLCSTDPSRLTTNDRKIMSFEFFNKMITENNQKLACCLVGTLCKDSLPLSEKVAFVLIRGIFSSNYDTIQPYLDVVSAFVLIDDRFKDYRLKWVLGMPTLSLSSFDKSILAFNVYTIEERLYFFDSTLQMEQTTISMLEALYKNFDRTQIYCTLILKCLLQMCLADEFVFDYMVCVPAPCLKYSRYIDFFGPFIQKFIE
jgi:ubiquitin carboxyl-terminal hydrolase 34